jgi:hypothetical protein
MADSVYKTADAARAAATSGSKPTAFAQMSAVPGTGNLNSPSVWNDPQNLFYQFAYTTDPSRKAQAFQNLARNLNQYPSQVAGYKNQFDYLQAKLIKSGLAKNALSISSALDKVVGKAIEMNTSPYDVIDNYIGAIGGASKKIAQPDTTTQYTKQIQTAMQFKDLGDARQYYADAYFTAWGKYPSAELDKKFQDAWNVQVKTQEKPTTTKTTSELAPIYNKKSKPVIDPKTKKQKIDKFGNPVYSQIAKDANGRYRYVSTITGTSTSAGEGFTQPEQEKFLADFLVANNPNAKWDIENLGGTAKKLYDGVISFYKSNYLQPPSLDKVAPLIANVLSSTDEKVSTEYITQFQNTARKQIAGKYMSIADYINAGENADTYVKPVLDTISAALEKNFTIDDPFALSIFNFKDDKGVYRLPNAYELNQMIVNHPDYGKTSSAINEAVDLTQNLKNKLGRS